MVVGIAIYELVADEDGGNYEQFEKTIIPEAIEGTRKEADCLVYNWYRDTKQGGKFICLEIFANREAVQKHFTQPHTRQLLNVCSSSGFLKMRVLEAFKGASHSLHVITLKVLATEHRAQVFREWKQQQM